MTEATPSDPVEKIVYEALCAAKVAFTRERHGAAPGYAGQIEDFLTDSGVAIECKRLYTPRSMKTLAANDEVILIQGIGAAKEFAALILRSVNNYDKALGGG